MTEVKRVILRLSEAEHDESDIYEPVRAYFFKKNRSLDGLDANQHFIHVQPHHLESLESDPKIHIINDLEKGPYSGSLDEDFPHEFYRVRRAEGKLVVLDYKEGKWFDNFKGKVRAITDDIYPWGCTQR